jgi:hypothetical protein
MSNGTAAFLLYYDALNRHERSYLPTEGFFFGKLWAFSALETGVCASEYFYSGLQQKYSGSEQTYSGLEQTCRAPERAHFRIFCNYFTHFGGYYG